MTDNSTPDYYQRREQQERALAASSVSPVIASVHQDMADRYAQLVYKKGDRAQRT